MSSAQEATLPGPLVPSEVDLRNFSYMPLYVVHLRDSDFAAETSGEEFKAAVLLWCAAWHQVPAGSLPDSDKALRRFSGLSLSDWNSVRNKAMSGFIKCSDGRLYHPVLADAAKASWDEKEKRKQRTEKATQSRKNESLNKISEDEQRYVNRDEERNDKRSAQRGVDRDDTRSVDRDVSRNVHQVEGKGREGIDTATEKLHDPPNGQQPPLELNGTAQHPGTPLRRLRPPGTKPPEEPTAGTQVFLAYSAAYEQVYSVAPVRDAKTASQCKTLVERLGAEEAPQIAAWFVTHRDPFYVRSAHSLDLLVRDYQRVRTEWHRRSLNGSGGSDPKPRGVVV